MGLDMFLVAKTHHCYWKPKEKEKDFPLYSKEYLIGYWRKHPNLHGFMVESFSGGNDDCKIIHLDAENLEFTIKAIEEEKLPHTEGFFFGSSDGSEKEEDLKIFRQALAWLKEPASDDDFKSVYYRASW